MAKKSKRSRNGSSKNKRNRPSLTQGPSGLSQASSLQGGASRQALATLATSEALHDPLLDQLREARDSSAPDAISGEQPRGDETGGDRMSAGRAPESERRRRAASTSGEMLPPPRDEAPSDPAFDEVSIPPVTTSAFADSSASTRLDAGEHDHSELEDSFFVRRAAVEAAHAHQAHHDEVDRQLDPRTAQKRTAAAHARRAHLSRYVKWTVGVSAALLAIGIGRVAFRGKPEFAPPPPIVHTAMAAMVDPTPHDLTPRDPNAPLPAPTEESQAAADQAVAALDNAAPTTGATPPAADPATTAAQTALAADPAQKPADPATLPATPPVQGAAQAVAPAAAPAAPVAAPASDKTAAQEKKASSQALERGNAKAAIEAGERSVALDPTDGEAWLVLGAAYQQVGKNADAHRCFTSCIKEGKRGPIGECRQMLQ